MLLLDIDRRRSQALHRQITDQVRWLVDDEQEHGGASVWDSVT